MEETPYAKERRNAFFALVWFPLRWLSHLRPFFARLIQSPNVEERGRISSAQLHLPWCLSRQQEELILALNNNRTHRTEPEPNYSSTSSIGSGLFLSIVTSLSLTDKAAQSSRLR
jgi:hypothetical protein